MLRDDKARRVGADSAGGASVRETVQIAAADAKKKLKSRRLHGQSGAGPRDDDDACLINIFGRFTQTVFWRTRVSLIVCVSLLGGGEEEEEDEAMFAQCYSPNGFHLLLGDPPRQKNGA